MFYNGYLAKGSKVSSRDQALKNFLISLGVFSKFIGTISCKSVENMTPQTLNVQDSN